MQMNDQRDINAPRSEVWAALLSADVLKECVPGAQEVTGNPDDGFEAVVVQKVGPVKATFKGQVSLTDMVEGQSLTLSGEGKGGAAGFAKGEAKVQLEDIPEGTRLIYEVEAKVGGKLAQLGSRLIDGFAKKMADQFFENFQNAVEGPADDAADESGRDEGGAGQADEGTEEAPKKKGWLSRLKKS
ncbi:MAG: CoxG family protein [Rhodobacterales bacterium]